MRKQISKRPLRLALTALAFIASFWWSFSEISLVETLAIIAVTLVLGFGLGMISLSFRLKDAFVRLFAPGSLRLGFIEEFTNLDRAELERLTKCWQEIGFELGVDRAGNMDNPAYGQTFSRTLEHPAQGAIVEISQIFIPDQTAPVTSSVMSFWGERAPIFQVATRLENAVQTQAPLAEPGAPLAATAPELADEMDLWALVTHNRAPNKFWPLLWQKRLLSRRMASDMTPENLWHAHLEQRADIEPKLDLPHEIGELEALLDAYNIVLSARLHAKLMATPAWKFGWTRLAPTKASDRYDGELPA